MIVKLSVQTDNGDCYCFQHDYQHDYDKEAILAKIKILLEVWVK